MFEFAGNHLQLRQKYAGAILQPNDIFTGVFQWPVGAQVWFPLMLDRCEIINVRDMSGDRVGDANRDSSFQSNTGQ